MAYSTQRATSDGTMAYLDLSIQYMKRADIKVFFNGLPAPVGTWAWVGTTDKRIAFTPTLANGTQVLIQRTTQIASIINVFANGAKFNNATMDQDFTQLLYLNQEAVEGAALSDVFNDVDFHGFKIKNVGVAVADNDAITFGQVKTMSNGAYTAQLAAQAAQSSSEAARDLAQKWASQTPASVDGTNFSAKQYALNAAGSATAASSSAGAASGSASAAAGSASAASGSASTAAGSASAAQTAKTAAESARDTAQTVAADVLNIQQDATDAINIANTFDGRLTTAETNASNAVTTAGTANTNATAALTAAGVASIGQCRFNFVSSTQCALVRFNGKYLLINGTPQIIPAAGVTLANTGLTAGATYYVYAYMNGATMTLEVSATSYSQDSATGVPIKTGDATRTLVGMVYMAAGTPGVFQQSGTQLGVLSWFNRRRIYTKYATTAGTISGTTYGQNGNQSGVLNWANELVTARLEDASASPNTGSAAGYAGISVDSTTTPFTTTFFQAWTANAQGDISGVAGNAANAEGIHIYRMLSRVSGGTCAFSANMVIETMG